MASKAKTSTKAKGKSPLNPQQRLVVYAVAAGKTQTDAAIEAGYSETSAYATGSRIMKIHEARELLASLQQKVAERVTAELEAVVHRLVHILESDPIDAYDEHGNLRPLKDWPVDLRKSVGGIKSRNCPEGCPECGEIFIAEIVEVKFPGRTSASDQLMKHLGGYREDNKQRMGLSDLIARAREARGQ